MQSHASLLLFIILCTFTQFMANYSLAAPLQLESDGVFPADHQYDFEESLDLQKLFLNEGFCYDSLFVTCVLSHINSPFLWRGNEMLYYRGGRLHKVLHLYNRSLNNNQVTSLYSNDNYLQAKEIPVPNVGFLLYLAGLLSLVFIGRLNKQKLASQ